VKFALFLFFIACTKTVPPFPLERGLDHVGIAVKDLDAARATFHDGLGFGGMESGRLPNGIQNINYYFEDSTYLETLTAWDAQKAGWLADFVAKHEGESFAVLSVSSAQQTKEFLDGRGTKTGAPIEGSIQTARSNGGHWQTLFFDHSPLPADPIFFIAYPPEVRAKNLAKLAEAVRSGKIYKHPNGALGVKAAWLAVSDLDAAVKSFEAIGMPADAAISEPRLGAKGRTIDAGQGKIFLVTPSTPDGEVAKLLKERGGPGLMGLSIEVSILGVAQGFVARFTSKPALTGAGVLGQSVWVFAHGSWLELFQQGS
jgi:catechol 2,3-dioxygenase-like lactoylglutathione lyase family enzyme